MRRVAPVTLAGLSALALSVGLALGGGRVLVELGLVAAAGVLFFSTRAKIGRSSVPEAVPIVWPAILFPTVYSLRGLVGSLTILILILGLVMLTLRPRVTRIQPWCLVLLGGAGLHVVLEPATRAGALLALASTVVVYRVATRYPQHRVVMSIIDGVGLYLVANVLLNIAGVQSPSAATRTGGLDLAGGGERIFYPLAQSIMTAPVMAAIALSSSLIIYERGRGRLLFRFVYLACAVLVLVRADSRFALAIAVVMTGASLMRPELQRRFAVPIAACAMGSVLLFPLVAESVVQPALNFTETQFGAFDARSGDNRNETLNGRTIIWKNSIDFWSSSVRSPSQRLFGFGAQGQATSGASVTYAHLFAGGYAEPRLASSHNAALQELFDAGLVGLASFLGFILLGLRRWAKLAQSCLHARYGLAALLAATLTGATEVIITPGFGHEPLWVVVALTLLASARPLRAEFEHEADVPAYDRAIRGEISAGVEVPVTSLKEGIGP